MLNAPRVAADTKIADIYSNNILTNNKRAILRMPNFNRQFLPEEIEQFLHNEDLQTKGRKRYIYNSEIHGNDEKAFKIVFERMNSGKHEFSTEMLKKIREMNQAKFSNNEQVHLIPWKVCDNLT